MTAAALAERLNARPVRPGEWRCRCPLHRGRSRNNLSVRQTDDGRILVYDFGGCRTDAILAAVGLRLADLYDSPRSPRPEDALETETRHAVEQARAEARRHPGLKHADEISFILTDAKHADEAAARALALAALGEAVQVILESEIKEC